MYVVWGGIFGATISLAMGRLWMGVYFRVKRYFLSAVVVAMIGCNPAYAQEVFHGCPMEGSATTERLKALNREKNRYDLPPINSKKITFDTLLLRTDNGLVGQTATIEGYVTIVKPGGIESCNCKATDPAYRDIHIMLVKDEKHAKAIEGVIVEVTPRLRALVKEDWSSKMLKKTLLHHFVRITGWIFYDEEHANASQNTNPKGKHNWRGTPYEIHPITNITIIK